MLFDSQRVVALLTNTYVELVEEHAVQLGEIFMAAPKAPPP